jgi:hypothetical protein
MAVRKSAWSWSNGSAANGTGKHRLQRDNRTDDYPSRDASLACTGGYTEDDEHEDSSKD